MNSKLRTFSDFKVKAALAAMTVLAALVPAAPAAAIIGGAPDGTAHSYVGGIDAKPGPISTASGVLISPTVVVTAGHGTRRIEQAGLTQARVTFDPVASDSSAWYTGTVHTNPAYDPQSADDPGDLGVIVFDTPVPGVTPASLPTLGQLDRLGAPGLNGASINVVAYGISRYLTGQNGGPQRPDFSSAGTRRIARETFTSLTPAWLRLRMNDGAEICTGDSGSPSLLGDSNVVAGITVGEVSLSGGKCVSQPWDTRLDTPSSRAFLGQYVTLP
jgi:V8-like Glu-specific endopeptidase